MRSKYSSFEFLAELKGLENAYAQLNSRIKHIKKRLKIFEYFERLRSAVFRNHNEQVCLAIDEVHASVDRVRGLVSEFKAYYSRLSDIIQEVLSAQAARKLDLRDSLDSQKPHELLQPRVARRLCRVLGQPHWYELLTQTGSTSRFPKSSPT